MEDMHYMKDMVRQMVTLQQGSELVLEKLDYRFQEEKILADKLLPFEDILVLVVLGIHLVLVMLALVADIPKLTLVDIEKKQAIESVEDQRIEVVEIGEEMKDKHFEEDIQQQMEPT